MLKSIGFWSRVAAANAAGSLLAVLVFTSATWQTPWREILDATGSTFVYAFCCSSLGFLTLPRVAPVFSHRLAAPLRWAAIATVLVACASAGSFIAVLLKIALGFMPPDRLLAVWVSSLKTSIYFTLIFGIFFTVTGGLRARLNEAALALRTKERDEADAQRLTAEAHLSSLESRVDPHFLFNTLNSVSELVHENPSAAERVVGQLASLMRSSLDRNGSALVPLEQELGFVQNYLDIERVRFGDRLRYTIDASTSLRSTLVPRLSLQTLVENSVKYAVSSRREGASVFVHAATVDGHVRLDVADDGPGFDPSLAPPGHGLELLRARLALHFGGRATLSVASVPSGTVVSIDLPFEPRPEPRAPSEPLQ